MNVNKQLIEINKLLMILNNQLINVNKKLINLNNSMGTKISNFYFIHLQVPIIHDMI